MPHSSRRYFISDLHLDPSRPQHFKLFQQFIASIHDEVDALYILGDLFEFWIGDDIIDLPIGAPYLPVIQQLKALSDSGVELFFIQGNRDFLAQQVFVKRIGATLLPDQYVIDLNGKPTLLMHGDTLCSDDKGYQRMRYIFRMRLIQKFYLMLSPESREAKANRIRAKSQQMGQAKQQTQTAILDVNQSTVEAVMLAAGVSQLIHGHTHRAALHEFSLNGQAAKRIVLGDWRDKACYLRSEGDELELIY